MGRSLDHDRRLWVIPPELTKAGRKHEVPLSAGAWAIIERRFKEHGDEPFVFSNPGRACNVCEQPGHIGQPLDRTIRALSIKAGFLTNVGTADEPEWTGEQIRFHDLRRTVADRMANTLGIAPHVVDAVLGHSAPGLQRVYMPSGTPLRDIQDAMNRWDRHLESILSPASLAEADRFGLVAVAGCLEIDLESYLRADLEAAGRRPRQEGAA